MPDSVRFLAIEDVLRLHRIAIIDQGGDPSMRDRGLLESAIAIPQQRFGGEYLHDDIPSMAAAYAFHICKNHPFIDGNKRAGTAAMIAFLVDNGWKFDATADEAEPAILKLAAGAFDKSEFTQWARTHMNEKPRLELRDFFASLRIEHLDQAVPSMVEGSGSTPEEFERTSLEAEGAIPLVRDFFVRYTREADPIQREMLRQMGLTFIGLYRIAEDMGYEW